MNLLDFRLTYDEDETAWQELDDGEREALFIEALAHIDALQDRIDDLPDYPGCSACGAIACGCDYDRPGDVCGVHVRPVENP